MPLTGNVQQNIQELYEHGTRKRSRKQILAIAESAAKETKRTTTHKGGSMTGTGGAEARSMKWQGTATKPKAGQKGAKMKKDWQGTAEHPKAGMSGKVQWQAAKGVAFAKDKNAAKGGKKTKKLTGKGGPNVGFPETMGQTPHARHSADVMNGAAGGRGSLGMGGSMSQPNTKALPKGVSHATMSKMISRYMSGK